MWIDTHAHLTSSDLFDNIDAILSRAKEAQVSKIINICTDEESFNRGKMLSVKHSYVYQAAAATPHDAKSLGNTFFPIVEQACQEQQLIAIGETGLDYFYEHSPRDIQQHCLEQYLQLANRYRLPIILHCRNAFQDLVSFGSAYPCLSAVIHCFTGTLEEARNVLDLGWYLSFSGIITFKKSEALRKVVYFTPLDRMVIETDAPYLTPQSKRGIQNEPAFLNEVATCIAEVKAIDIKMLADILFQNSMRFFSFSKPSFEA